MTANSQLLITTPERGRWQLDRWEGVCRAEGIKGVNGTTVIA